MPKDIQAGCIRFDSAAQVEGGWASIEGGEPFRFDTVSDVDSNCFFVSNIGFNEAHRTGLSSSSKIRTTNYFDTDFYSIGDREINKKIQNQSIARLNKSPNDMISQLGINDEDWEGQVKICSEIFSRIYTQAKDTFGMQKPPFYELKKGIHDEMLTFNTVIKDPKLFDALESSTTHYSLVQRPIDAIQLDVDYGINVTIPKVSHALEILSKPLPEFDTEWKLLPNRIRSKDVPAYLDGLEPHGIYLFRVNFKSFSEEYAQVVNFGTGTERRAWITGAEAQFYKDISVFEIYQGFEALSVMEHAPGYEELSKLYSPEKHNLSYSASLFLQNAWLSLTKSKPAPANVVKNFDSFNVFTPFLKAYDRLALIETAKKLSEMNVVVTSYSKSEIRIVLRDTQLNQESFEIFKSAGVFPYGLKMSMEGYDVDNTADDLLRKIYMEGATDSIMMLDKKFWEQNSIEEELDYVG